MPLQMNLPPLFAEQATKLAEKTVESPIQDTLVNALFLLIIFFVVLILPFLLGSFIAKTVRMRDYGWRIGLILCTIFCSLLIVVRSWDPVHAKFKIPLGVDLKGGVILIYEVKVGQDTGTNQGKRDQEINMNDLVTALANRINPSGTKEIVVRPYGDRQVEIIIPEVDPREVDHIKRLISTAGSLEFRIVANREDHPDIIELATEQAQDPTDVRRLSKSVMREKKQVGMWVQAAKEKMSASEIVPCIVRNAQTGRILDISKMIDAGQVIPIRNNEQKLDQWLKENGIQDVEILMAADQDPENVVIGEDLGVVSGGVDDFLSPCVKFRLNSAGAEKFRWMTSQNLPSTDRTPPFYRHLGIVLDGRLLSFPRIMSTISDSGQITGNFTQDEVDFLVGVLRAGRLPASLKKEPISENQIGSMLGDDTIAKGKWAIGFSLLAVLIFVGIYYMFSGVIACIALLLNLLFIFALMILLKAPLTLPGLAGLVLTVGMSVDANVLIFERIREEINRGAALRMAIRNGFGKATTTIVDANVTTLITAIVLYAIGTDQIRGFAVTLILGILMSMFTAIFCSRVVFDIAERKHWVTKLKMLQIIGGTKVDFIGKRHVAIGASLLLIVIGLVGVGLRGEGIFDIDFTGGTSVTMVLNQSMPPAEVRHRLDTELSEVEQSAQFTVSTVSVEGRPVNSVYKIDSDVAKVIDLEKYVMQAFRDKDGKSLLTAYRMDIVAMREGRSQEGAAGVNPVKKTAAPAEKPPAATKSPAETKQDDTPAKTAEPAKKAAPATKKAAPVKKAAPATKKAAPVKKAAPDKAGAQSGSGSASEPAKTNNPKKAPATAPKKDTPAKPAGNSTSSRRTDLPGDEVLAWAGLRLAQAEPAKPAAGKSVPAAPKENAAKKDAEKKAVEQPAKTPAAEKQLNKKPAAQAPAAEKPAPKKSAAEKPATDKPAAAKPANSTPPAAKKTGDAAAPKPTGNETPAAKKTDAVATIWTTAQLKFRDKINAPTVRDAIMVAAKKVGCPVAALIVSPTEVFNWDQSSAAAETEWYINMIASQADTRKILTDVQQTMAATPVWPSSSLIGGKVAGDTRDLAIAALLASLLGIIGYIWIRFQHVVFGVAAVVALIHDVLITLGAIAVSRWLAGPLGFMQIDEFKISLPIVAAFLTIIGYSLNDTIVVFDRIREVRGKSPKMTADMINLSINQTLSRTLLTSLTTFIVVAILFAIGGQGIHGFAFALVVGVLVGTYSSVFIASPVLFWLMGYSKEGKRAAAESK